MFSALLKNNKHLSAAQSVHQFTLQKNQEFFDDLNFSHQLLASSDKQSQIVDQILISPHFILKNVSFSSSVAVLILFSL